jgi:hypothetical protein
LSSERRQAQGHTVHYSSIISLKRHIAGIATLPQLKLLEAGAPNLGVRRVRSSAPGCPCVLVERSVPKGNEL